jgi:enoyl-CoA hydratase/carnithine racemase
VQPTEISTLYHGPANYVTVTKVEAGGKHGAMFYYANPEPRKLQAVDTRGMQEWEAGLTAIEAVADQLSFVVFYGSYDPLHAGADITEFAGEPDFEAIRAHLLRGAVLDSRVKSLWQKFPTVSVFCGDRYGGSVEWPLFSEYAVADARCTIQLSEVTLGIIPGWNGVLNVLLKAGASNALYMGQTGNQINAEQMLAIGLVQRLVETPDPPIKALTAPEDWPSVWSMHSEHCNTLLLDAAVELALDPPQLESRSLDVLCNLEDLFAEVNRRTNPQDYIKLHDEIAGKAAALATDDAVGHRELLKQAAASLALMGKPLAPQAVAAVSEFVQQWNKLGKSDLLLHYHEAGIDESERCAQLMHTAHREVGVNAVLTKNPAQRIPVFD